MIIMFMILLVAVCILVAIAMTRKWLLQTAGVDIEHESLEKQHERLNDKQKLLLALLMFPPVVFVLWLIVYVLASAVVTAIGISPVTG